MAELILSLKDRELSRHPLAEEVRVGRDPENEVVIDNVGVSRHHATIGYDGAAYFVRDEGSQNGVFVNGQRVSAQYLRDGDVVQLGKFALRLSLHSTGVSQPSLSIPSSRSASREMLNTVALAPSEVQRLVAEQQLMLASRAPTQDSIVDSVSDPTWKILGYGLLGVIAVGIVGYFLLVR